MIKYYRRLFTHLFTPHTQLCGVDMGCYEYLSEPGSMLILATAGGLALVSRMSAGCYSLQRNAVPGLVTNRGER